MILLSFNKICKKQIISSQTALEQGVGEKKKSFTIFFMQLI